MTDHRTQYEKWLAFPELDAALKAELAAISGDENEIKERFSLPLAFGTAGLRGVIRAGINGMNVYTVAQATQGLAGLVLKNGGKDRGVVIVCDTRILSEEFARISACVLAGNGIRAYLFDAPRPTPELSFSLRHLGAIAGINITASHNPKIYNGYKAYWEDGAQLSPEQAQTVSDEIGKVDVLTGAKIMDYDKAVGAGLITVIGKDLDEAYLDVVLKERIRKNAIADVADTFRVVYTPFHGTGRILVPEVLRRAGIKHLFCVPEQMVPDGNFPTVKSPNPEDKAGFALAIEIAKAENCDLLIGTDPDADRTGVIVRTHENEFVPLTGNQIGVMLLSYIIEARRAENRLPANAAAVKSIVSTKLADRICVQNGVTPVNVLTGFKFIGEKIKEWETSHEHTYIFGFEESYGYLSGTYARDKDAVCSSLLITEMAAYYAARGKSLYDVLLGIYKKYGFYEEGITNVVMPGLDGLEKMKNTMEALRRNAPKTVAGFAVASVADYETGLITDASGKTLPTGLPTSNVLFYTLENGDSIVVRPSGTEPKIKLYFLTSGKNADETSGKIASYGAQFRSLMNL